MEIDQNRFANLVIEKTNAKLNQLQNQVIVLESQLQLAVETNKQLKGDLDKINKRKTKTSTTEYKN